MKTLVHSVSAALAAFALLALPFQTSAKPFHSDITRVKVGAQTELDACTSIGHGKAALIVRPKPSSAARVSDRLLPSHLIWICEERGNARWYGIVYGPAAKSRSKTGVPPACGVSSPIARPTLYRGPCKSGWVSAGSVEMIAG